MVRRTLSVAREGLRDFRQRGVLASARVLSRRYIYGLTEFVIFRQALAKQPVDDRPGEIAFRLATPADLERLPPLGRRGHMYRQQVGRDGDWLFVACDGDRILATRLISKALPRYGLLSKAVLLTPSQVWGTDLFCLPKYRGRGIARRLMRFTNQYLASLGYAECLYSVAPTNAVSLRLQLDLGAEPISYVSHRRLLLYGRLRVSREIPAHVWALRGA